MKKYLVDYDRYSFKSEDDWGDYDDGKYGFCYRNITRCCRGERKTHKGYIWSYEPL